MMSPRERVLAVYAHEEPDRVPIWCGMSDGFMAKARRHLGIDDEGLLVRFGDDFRRVWPRYRGPDRPLLPNANSCTVFGVYHGGIGWGQPLSHPLTGTMGRAALSTAPEYEHDASNGCTTPSRGRASGGIST